MAKKTSIKGVILLFICAFIWGTAFVAQQTGMDYVGPFTFCFVRYFLGSFALIPVILVRRQFAIKANPSLADKPILNKATIKCGIICGTILFVASNLQQFGLQYTTVGKSGFLTALYILIVPLLGLFFKRKVPLRIWICVLFAVVGLYLLCINEKFELAIGDIITIFCAVGFSAHILYIDSVPGEIDGITLASVQFFTTGFLSMIPALIMEDVSGAGILGAAIPILYTGIMSSGVAYTLQIVAQRMVKPTAASLIMSLESVVSAVAGWILLNEILSVKEMIGCAIMFAATCVAQIPDKKKSQS